LAAQGCKCPQDVAQVWEDTPVGVEDLVASEKGAPTFRI
jgi:hypothetical protein